MLSGQKERQTAKQFKHLLVFLEAEGPLALLEGKSVTALTALLSVKAFRNRLKLFTPV